MSEAALDAVREIYQRWSGGDFRAGVDLYDPHMVLVQRAEFPEAGAYVGTEAIARYMRGFLEAWSRVTIEAEELVDAGDSIVAAVVQRAVGKESGAEPTEFRYFQVWSFRGDRVMRLEVVRDRDDALGAVGLPF